MGKGKEKYMTKEQYVEYVEGTDFDKIRKEQGLEADEIFLPEAEEEGQNSGLYEEFVMVPACKYEMMIRDSEKLAAVTRYVCSENPQFKGVKALLEVE